MNNTSIFIILISLFSSNHVIAQEIKAQSIIGKWKFEKSIVRDHSSHKKLSEMSDPWITQSFNFKKDYTYQKIEFIVNDGIINYNATETSEGKWSINGNKLILICQSVNGKKLDQDPNPFEIEVTTTHQLLITEDVIRMSNEEVNNASSDGEWNELAITYIKQSTE